ncbi:MAG: hypothetical protein M5U09_22305, partial [Gammaproteobacteria bacterium]|nr:hypothetical protein [Gammaproteobacteria bacterium]
GNWDLNSQHLRAAGPGAEVATFGGDRLIFIGSERASLVGVYKDVKAPARPDLSSGAARRHRPGAFSPIRRGTSS